MVKLNEMNDRQRKVFDSVYNGWYMGGKYRALIDEHEKTFFADSLGILFNDVEKWYATHEKHHGSSRLLVKCVEVR